MVVSIASIVGTSGVFTANFVSSVPFLSILLAAVNFLLTVMFVSMMSIPLKLFSGAKVAPSYARLANGGIIDGFASPMLIGFLVKMSNGLYTTTFMYF